MPTESSDNKPFFQHWGPLMVLVLGLIIAAIDSSLLNVALGTIIKDLHTTITKMQWVISAYSLTLGAFLITGGRLGDLYGRKKMFIVGAFIFAVGSFIASISHHFITLLIGESIIEGIGAALMLPATSSLLVATYHGRDRAIAYGFWGTAGAVGVAIGPLLGGYLTTHYDWRWGFRINLVVAALLIIGSRIIHTDKSIKETGRFDWLGVILSAAGMFGLMFAIIESPTYGLIFKKQLFSLGNFIFDLGRFSVIPLIAVLGAALLVLFFIYESWREENSHAPLLSLHLFENQQFRSGTLAYGLFALTQTSIMFTIAVFFQSVRHYDAIQTGYIYLPLSLTLAIAAPLMGYLSAYIAPKRLIQTGFILQMISCLYIAHILSPETTILTIILPTIVSSVGLAMLSSQVANLTLSAVPVSETREASGVNQSLRQIGTALGTAVTGAIIVAIAAAHLQTWVGTTSIIPTTEKSSVSSSITSQTTSLEFSRLQLPSSVAGTTQQAVNNQLEKTIVDGNKWAFVFIALFALLGLIVSGWLPLKK